jgi:MFS family permease
MEQQKFSFLRDQTKAKHHILEHRVGKSQCIMMLRKSGTGTWMPAWVPESTPLLSLLLLLCSMAQTGTNGCDGTMLNGFNILPSYSNYFNLTNTTKGLNTTSIFIGAFFGMIWSGIMADRLGRRPAILYGSLISLVGIALQTAAQNIAMFVIARIILGWGGAISGVAGAVYLSEAFPSRWRAWGVGLLNNCYYVGAFLAALVTLGTSHWESTWAWRTPSLFQATFSIISILLLPFIPESPRWLIGQGRFEDARISVAQTNSNGNVADPVSTAIYKQIVDALEWEKKQGRTMRLREIFKTPMSRKRVLIGGSVGPFSCIAGNVIASYYLGAELATAGITNSNSQLKAASIFLLLTVRFVILMRTERRNERVVPRLLSRRYQAHFILGSKANRFTFSGTSHRMPVYHWGLV